MKVLIAAQGYFPAKAYGGPPVSTKNFSNLLSGDVQTYIVTSNHEHGSKEKLEGIKDGWQRIGNAKVLYLSDSQKTYKNFLKIVNNIKPDWIYLNSLFDAPNVVPFLRIARKLKIKVLLAPRGELCKGAFKKKYKKLPYILALKTGQLFDQVSFQSTSEEETETIQRYIGKDLNDIHYLTNIPSITTEKYSRKEKRTGKGNFVFLARVHPKKNLIGAIRYLQKIKGEVHFDIYGPLEDDNYWSECKTEIQKLPANIIVKYCGLVDHDEVHRVFSNYNAFLFPTFSENYGHVIAESLAVGTPVIISDQTPWNDVNDAKAGWSIALNNEDGFIEAIQEIVNADNNQMTEISNRVFAYIENKLRLDNLRTEYLDAINELLRG